jgi:hypothetical protein
MADRLVQCPACSRHVKSRDPACPFCGAQMAGAPAPARTPFLRLQAAAAVAAGVAALVACADTEVPLPSQVRSSASDDAAGGPSGEDSGFQPEPDPSGVVFYGSAGGGGIIERPDATLAPPDGASDGAPDGALLEVSDGASEGVGDASDGAAVDGASDGAAGDGADGG